MIRIAAKILLVAAALLLAARFIPGIDVAGTYPAIIAALALGVVNLIVRPVILLLTLPVNLLTFGLFTFVVNAGLLWFVATFIEGFSVAGFVPAFLGALVVSAASWVAGRLG